MNAAILLIVASQEQGDRLLDTLTQLGYKSIDLVPTESEAIERLSKTAYAMAIIDLDSRNSEVAIQAGYSIGLKNNVPLIFLGNHPDSEISDHLIQIRPWAFLTKPLRDLDLRMAVENILYRHIEDKTKVEKQRQTLLNNLPGLAYQCLNDQHWTMLFLSQGCLELTGHEPSDIILNQTISYHDLIHPDDRAMVRQTVEDSHKDQFELTYRIRTKDGQVKWVLERGIKTNQSLKGAAIIEGVIVDIDEKMRAEMRLKLSLKELKILDSLNACANEGMPIHEIFSKTVAELDKNYGINTNLYYYEKERNRLVGQHTFMDSKTMKKFELFLGHEIPEIKIDLVEGSLHHSIVQGPAHFFTSDPSQILQLAKDFAAYSNYKELLPLVDDKISVKSVLGVKLKQEGSLYGLLSARSKKVMPEEEVKSIITISEGISNIIARRTLEKKLVHEESRYKTLWEMAPNGIVTIDAKGYVRSVNNSFLRITGFSEPEFLNKHIRDIPSIPESSLNEYLKLFTSLLTKGRSRPIEFRWVHKNGSLNWGEAYISLIKEGRKISGIQAVVSDITQRKNSLQMIKESEDLYRTVISKSPMPILLVKEGKITFTNPVLQKLMGVKKTGQLIGRSAMDIVASEYRPLVKNRLKDLAEGKSNKPAVFKMNRKDDLEVFVEFSSVPVIINGEQLAIVMGRDISQQRLMEEKLRESEKLLSSILQAAPIGIGLVKERVFYWINDAFVKMLGYNKKELIGQNSAMIYPSKEIWEEVGLVKYARLKKDKIAQVESRFRTKDGKEIDVLLSSVALNPKNNTESTIFTAIDITQNKASERILKENEERYRTLFENMAQGVYYQGSDGKFLDVNRAALRILGITKEQFLGKASPPSEWKFTNETLEEIHEDEFPAIISLRTGKKTEDVVIRFLNPKLNKHIWLLVNSQPQFRPGESNPYQVFVTLHDLTDIKNAEIELTKSYQEIKMLSRRTEEIREEERKQIARNLHDELGQILTAIKMDVSWIKNRIPEKEELLTPRAEATLEIIDQAIVGVQQISSHLRPPILDNLGLFEALKSLLTDFRKRTGIKTNIRLPDKETQFHPDFMISIYRIIQEALTNVIRHADASHVGLIIMEKNNTLEIQIKDNGLGISEEGIHSSDSLGLIGIKERILRWNGELEISGQAGEGTLLRIVLPIISTK